MKSEEAIAVVEILSPMTPAFGYTRRLAFFDPFSDVLRLIHRLGLVSSKELALLRLSTTSERYGYSGVRILLLWIRYL
ncbi:unnamed protein product [Arabidopsis halleri]